MTAMSFCGHWSNLLLNAEYGKRGRSPDLIFATGNIAHSGKPDEYSLADKLFDDLLHAARLDKSRLFVIPVITT